MFRFLVVLGITIYACDAATASLRLCNGDDIKKVFTCVMGKLNSTAQNCFQVNKCPPTFFDRRDEGSGSSEGSNSNEKHHQRKRRAVVASVGTPVGTANLTLNTRPVNVSGTPPVNISGFHPVNMSGLPSNLMNMSAAGIVNATRDMFQNNNIFGDDIEFCERGSRAHVIDVVSQCALKTIKGFSFPNFDDQSNNGNNGNSQQKSPFNESTCNARSLLACVYGRGEPDHIFPLRDQCLQELKINQTCDMDGTSNVIIECFDKNINLNKSDDLVKNFTGCIHNRKPLIPMSLNITVKDKVKFIDSESRKYHALQKYKPQSGCSKKHIKCVMGCGQKRRKAIEKCYRAHSGCQRPASKNMADMNMRNISSPFANYSDQSKVGWCGMLALENATAQVFDLMRRELGPVFDVHIDDLKHMGPHDGNDGDDDSSEEDDSSNESGESGENGNNHNDGHDQNRTPQNSGGGPTPRPGSGTTPNRGTTAKPICDQKALDTCLAGRNVNDDECGHENSCAYANNECDFKHTKSVACKCANTTFNEKFAALKSFMFKCLNLSESDSKYKISPEQREFFVHMAMNDYCSCVTQPSAINPATMRPVVQTNPPAKATTKATTQPTTKATTKPTTKATTKAPTKPSTKKSG